MYECFEQVPVEARQQAFLVFVAAKDKTARGHDFPFRVSIEGETYCPFGVINRVLGIEPDVDLYQNIPSPALESAILKNLLGVTIDPHVLAIFMAHLDCGLINTEGKFANALGIDKQRTEK